MELSFFKPKESNGTVKLTVHKSGKLGFSKNAIELLSLQENKYCKFGKNNTDDNDVDIYMVIGKDGDEYSYNISKAGDYYYIKAKSFLSDMAIDYTDDSKTVIFDIKEITETGNKIYRLKKREIIKRK